MTDDALSPGPGGDTGAAGPPEPVRPAEPGGHGVGAASHLRIIIGGLILLVLLAMIPDLSGFTPSADAYSSLVHARVVRAVPADADTGAPGAVVVLLDGPDAGSEVQAEIGVSGRTTPVYVVGEEVVVQVSPGPEGDLVAIVDRWRAPLLWGLAGLFGLLVVLVSGWRGVRALIALGITMVVVVKLLLPLLVRGWDPVVLAVLTGAGVTVVTLLLTEGARRTTAAAAIGTFAALLATALVGAVVNALASFSPLMGSEELGNLGTMLGADVTLSGLLMAAIILGALGVLDDVTITQAATVEELALADPLAARSTLVRRAMNVGRSHIAATVNTLVLAYVAASIPLLLLFAVSPQPLGALTSTEAIAIEIVRALVGSIGIVLAVPFTTLVAARMTPRRRVHARPLAASPGP
jgi:uncharacterized membrane protein